MGENRGGRRWRSTRQFNDVWILQQQDEHLGRCNSTYQIKFKLFPYYHMKLRGETRYSYNIIRTSIVSVRWMDGRVQNLLKLCSTLLNYLSVATALKSSSQWRIGTNMPQTMWELITKFQPPTPPAPQPPYNQVINYPPYNAQGQTDMDLIFQDPAYANFRISYCALLRDPTVTD